MLHPATPLVLVCVAIFTGAHALSKCPDTRLRYEHRCDHAKVEAFTLRCVDGLRANAGRSEGAAMDCRDTAITLYCDTVIDGNTNGRVWKFVDGQWLLK